MRYIGQESYGVLERGIPANSISGDTAGESEEGKQNLLCNARDFTVMPVDFASYTSLWMACWSIFSASLYV